MFALALRKEKWNHQVDVTQLRLLKRLSVLDLLQHFQLEALPLKPLEPSDDVRE